MLCSLHNQIGTCRTVSMSVYERKGEQKNMKGKTAPVGVNQTKVPWWLLLQCGSGSMILLKRVSLGFWGCQAWIFNIFFTRAFTTLAKAFYSPIGRLRMCPLRLPYLRNWFVPAGSYACHPFNMVVALYMSVPWFLSGQPTSHALLSWRHRRLPPLATPPSDTISLHLLCNWAAPQRTPPDEQSSYHDCQCHCSILPIKHSLLTL